MRQLDAGKLMNARATPVSALSSSFDSFLYAAVGEDNNGVLLTVVSVLARQNVDPWDHAAALSRLPAETAQEQLVEMLASLPSHTSLDGRMETAARLISLLPKATQAGFAVHGKLRQFLKGDGLPEQGPLTILALFLASMILGFWVFSGPSATPSVVGNGEDRGQGTSEHSTPPRAF